MTKTLYFGLPNDVTPGISNILRSDDLVLQDPWTDRTFVIDLSYAVTKANGDLVYEKNDPSNLVRVSGI